MKYLTFIRHSESYRSSPPPAALMDAMGKSVEQSFKDGTLVDTGGLLPSKDGVRLRLANGKITVTDGPFSESKEVIGGLGHPEGGLEGRRPPGRDRVHGAAPEVLAGLRGRGGGPADVRPGHGPVAQDQASKATTPTTVFERSRTMRVMVFVPGDRDSEAGKMPSQELIAKMMKFNEELVKTGVMLAGEGLTPSSKAKRVKFSGSQRTVTDGPFAESKELVAGYWLWQVRSIDEAVEWLKRAPFDAGVEVTIRPVFEAEDFGKELTPELRAKEERLRAEVERQRRS